MAKHSPTLDELADSMYPATRPTAAGKASARLANRPVDVSDNPRLARANRAITRELTLAARIRRRP